MTKAEEISCSRDGGGQSVSSKLSLHRTKLDSMFGRSHPTGAFRMFQSAFIALTSWNDSCRYDWRKKCGQRGHAAALRGSSLDTNTAAAFEQMAAGQSGRGGARRGHLNVVPHRRHRRCPLDVHWRRHLGPPRAPAPPSLLRFGCRGGAPISPTQQREAALAASALSRWSGIKSR